MTSDLILVIGANSRLGRAIMAAHPSATGIVRRATADARLIAVSDYRDISATDLVGQDIIINCTGVVTGSPEQLDRVNAILPVQLAEQARDAGARQFIQISSFSVYGRAELIARDTAEAPVSSYGRSKLAGDRALAQQATADFVVKSLRLPSLFDDRPPSNLATLARLVMKFKAWPIPAADVERAMMSFTDAASAVLHFAALSGTRIACAADPLPFSYCLLRDEIADVTGLRIGLLRMPGAVLATLRLLLPSIYARLFADSRLQAQDNVATDLSLPLGMKSATRALIRNLAD